MGCRTCGGKFGAAQIKKKIKKTKKRRKVNIEKIKKQIGGDAY